MAKRVLLERDKVNPVWERLLHIPVPPLATTSTFRYYMYLHVASYGSGAPATCNTTCTYVQSVHIYKDIDLRPEV